MFEVAKIGSCLCQAREKMGMTQIQLAEKIGISRSTLIRWESGSVLPQQRYWAALESFLQNANRDECAEDGATKAKTRAKVRIDTNDKKLRFCDLSFEPDVQLSIFRDELQVSKNVDGVKRAIQNFNIAIGVDSFLYFQVFRGEISKQPRGFFMTDVDVEWLQHYAVHNYKLHDPTWKLSWSSVLPVSTDTIYQHVAAKKQIRAKIILEDLWKHQHGYAYCLAVPIFGSCCKSVLSFAVRDRSKIPVIELLAPILQFVGNLIYDKIHQLIQHNFNHPLNLRLQKIERELLIHILQGDTARKIAKNFNISESAVHQRVEKLLLRFDVRNRQELCLLAVTRGLILHDLQHIKVITKLFNSHTLSEQCSA